MITKKQVLKKMEENKDQLKTFKVKKIGLFGSVLKGNQKKNSDIDILVDFKEVSFDNYAETLMFLEDLFRKRIDLVTIKSLRPELNYVKKEAKYARI